MPLPLFHPLHAIVGVVIVTALAAALARVVPFYRRELDAEAAMRVKALDGLRGILCFAVLFHHASIVRLRFDTGEWTPPPSAFYAQLGSESVALFFCVTGFLFWSRALGLDGAVPPVPFLRARMFRIAPLYLVSVAATIAVAADRFDWNAATTYVGIARMASLGFQAWGGIGAFPVWQVNAGVAWTLQYEWGFYLALPAFAPAAAARRGGPVQVTCLVAGLVAMFGLGVQLYFAIGVAAAYAARQPATAAMLRRGWVGLAVACTACAFPLLSGSYYGLRALALTTLIFVPIACGNTVLGLLSLRGLRLMGVVSYSVYLLHGIALHVAVPALGRAAAAGPGPYWVTATGVAVAVLAVGLTTYRWVEWPAIRWERRLRREPPTEAVVPAPAREHALVG